MWRHGLVPPSGPRRRGHDPRHAQAAQQSVKARTSISCKRRSVAPSVPYCIPQASRTKVAEANATKASARTKLPWLVTWSLTWSPGWSRGPLAGHVASTLRSQQVITYSATDAVVAQHPHNSSGDPASDPTPVLDPIDLGRGEPMDPKSHGSQRPWIPTAIGRQ